MRIGERLQSTISVAAQSGPAGRRNTMPSYHRAGGRDRYRHDQLRTHENNSETHEKQLKPQRKRRNVRIETTGPPRPGRSLTYAEKRLSNFFIAVPFCTPSFLQLNCYCNSIASANLMHHDFPLAFQLLLPQTSLGHHTPTGGSK